MINSSTNVEKADERPNTKKLQNSITLHASNDVQGVKVTQDFENDQFHFADDGLPEGPPKKVSMDAVEKFPMYKPSLLKRITESVKRFLRRLWSHRRR